MTAGLASAHCDSILGVLRNVTYSGFTPYLQQHTGDPGPAGTSNVSAETTRKALTFAAPSTVGSNRSSTASQVSWTWSAGGETLTHGSIWDAPSGGTFKGSLAWSSSRDVANGDTVNATVTATQGTLAV